MEPLLPPLDAYSLLSKLERLRTWRGLDGVEDANPLRLCDEGGGREEGVTLRWVFEVGAFSRLQVVGGRSWRLVTGLRA